MPETRNLFLIALAALGFMLWMQWQQDYSQPPNANSTQPQSSQTADPVPVDNINQSQSTADVPVASSDDPVNTGVNSQTSQPSNISSAELISVTTDVLDVLIDKQGGNVVSVKLLQYPVEYDKPEIPVQLLGIEGQETYVAQSGLLSASSPAPNHRDRYQSQSDAYQLGSNQELIVPLTWSKDGVSVEKQLIFKPGSYAVQVKHIVKNQSNENWFGSRYAQLQRTEPESVGGGFTNTERYSFVGGAYYTPDDKFQKVKFKKFGSELVDLKSDQSWVSMLQHYFLSAWIPAADSLETLESQVVTNGSKPSYIMRTRSQPAQVEAGSEYTFSNTLYVGPKLQERLTGLAKGLELTVDYGFFTIFAKPLFWALDKIHVVVGNWGWAIVILTILIKLAFFKLTEAQYKSMARMRKLQPRMEKLKERYGDDRQKMSQAMMEMYKTEKVNPLGGCLPILVQIPIFIALYWVLLESVELRQAPFVAWIEDLSSPDPYFILPLINGLAMIATQRLAPTTGMDPMQRKMMQALPVVFSVLFAFFPAGLVLYWATNASISLAQQWVITRRIDRMG